MRAIRVASAALLTATALTLTAPPASAAVTGEENITSFGFRVTPSTIAAGGQVTLSVDGCEHNTKVTSGVFDDVTIPKGQSSATAKVFWDAKPGAMYEVTFTCGQESGTTDLTIVGGGSTSNPSHHPTPHHTRGVKAGVGGSSGGFDGGQLALGGALIAGVIGTAYYWTRRRTGQGES
ncbi:hypothetical protein [Streptomyces flavofungini]|uniref:hypothetical protein n=1 Tax=Streptomyces flavofungini TaxID=68200 RepID=UPI0025B1C31F|nr:hypothetical protein [Streptomyces flavofungini]WJV44829.1 hypothetical protein QUY26_04355 [Streptomyces flavofungini]